MAKIHIIEDDPAIQEALTAVLQRENFTVSAFNNGNEGLQAVLKDVPELVLLDINLPGMNGFDICRTLRQEKFRNLIFMLTTKSDEFDKVIGLEIGADDYITKPFSMRELLARINAHFRRRTAEPQVPEEVEFGGLTVNFTKQEVFKNGKNAELSSKEFQILQYFLKNEGKVITRDMLLDDVWGYDHFPTTRTVDNYILSLRKKIETDPSSPHHIITVHTQGYKFSR